MRNALVVVSLLCVILVISFFKVKSNAASQLESAEKEIAGFSNKVAEAQTRLVMGQALTSDATNKLRTQIEQEVKHAAALSNQLQQARAGTASLSKELEASQFASGRQAARAEELEVSLQETKAKLQETQALASQAEQVRKDALAVGVARDEALREAQSLRLAKAEIENLLRNPAFLRSQLERMEQQARLAKKAARENLSQVKDPKAPLQLQSDGSVRVQTSTNSPATAGVSAPRR